MVLLTPCYYQSFDSVIYYIYFIQLFCLQRKIVTLYLQKVVWIEKNQYFDLFYYIVFKYFIVKNEHKQKNNRSHTNDQANKQWEMKTEY